MQRNSSKNKRRLLTVSLLLLLIGVLSYGTVAFFTDDDISTSVITAGNIDIKLIQEASFDEGTYNIPFQGISGVMPGEQVICKTSVENCGGFTAYVRVSVALNIVLDPGFSISVAPSNPVTIDFNTTDWTYIDGYYYYNEPLEHGASTAPLFTTVSFDSGMDNTFQNSVANLKVDAYATQFVNNGTSAFDAAGWLDPNE